MSHAFFKFEVIGDVVVVYSMTGQIAPEQWKPFVKALESPGVTKFLGVTMGSTEMSSIQRKEVIDILKRRNMQSTIVTEDKIVRGAATAASWFGVEVEAFSWDKLKDAIKRVRLAPPLDERLHSWILQMKRGSGAAP